MFIPDEPHVIFDFNVAADWGYRDNRPHDVVYIKKWQERMRREMPSVYAETLSDNVYRVDLFTLEQKIERLNSLLTLETIFNKDLGQDSARIATQMVMYWAHYGEHIIRQSHKLIPCENLTTEQREMAYLGIHESRNIPQSSLNQGRIPDDELVYGVENTSMRERKTGVTRMLKWFASDDGQGFIQACERNIDIKRHSRDLTPTVQTWLGKRQPV